MLVWKGTQNARRYKARMGASPRLAFRGRSAAYPRTAIRGLVLTRAGARREVRHHEADLVVRHFFPERKEDRFESLRADLPRGLGDLLIHVVRHPMRDTLRPLAEDEVGEVFDGGAGTHLHLPGDIVERRPFAQAPHPTV